MTNKTVAVPVMPTKEMQDAWDAAPHDEDIDKEFRNAYRAMIAAAPQPAQAGEAEGRFICPDCGSERWGTSNMTAPMDEWIGHCHGGLCKFTWKRKDDSKVFTYLQPQPQAVDERESFEKWVRASGRAHMLERDVRHGWYVDLNVTAWFAGWIGRASLSAQPAPVAACQHANTEMRVYSDDGNWGENKELWCKDCQQWADRAAHPIASSRDEQGELEAVIEMCAKVCEGRIGGAVQNDEWWGGFKAAMKQCATAIRALKTAKAEQAVSDKKGGE